VWGRDVHVRCWLNVVRRWCFDFSGQFWRSNASIRSHSWVGHMQPCRCAHCAQLPSGYSGRRVRRPDSVKRDFYRPWSQLSVI
jgi:hypothetical protein